MDKKEIFNKSFLPECLADGVYYHADIRRYTNAVGKSDDYKMSKSSLLLLASAPTAPSLKNKLSELRFIRLKDDRIFNNVPGCISGLNDDRIFNKLFPGWILGLNDDSMQILLSFNPENLSSDKRIN